MGYFDIVKRVQFNKISGSDLMLFQHRISFKCIKNAKTNEAKEILVHLVESLSVEEMKRMHVRGYAYKYEESSKAYPHEPSIWDTIKSIFVRK